MNGKYVTGLSMCSYFFLAVSFWELEVDLERVMRGKICFNTHFIH